MTPPAASDRRLRFGPKVHLVRSGWLVASARRGKHMSDLAPAVSEPTAEVTERRKRVRQRMVLRVGIIDDGRRPSYCLVRNISPAGVQVKLFNRIAPGAEVRLRVGDEEPLAGRVMWVRSQVSGIRFHELLEPERMLRVTQKLAPTKRRSSPRVNASARVVLRTGGRTYLAELRDISASGARIRTRQAVDLGPSVMLTLPDMPAFKTYVRWVAGHELGLVFQSPLPIDMFAGWLEERLSVSVA